MIRKLLSSYPRLDKKLRQWYRRAQFVRARVPGFTHWVDPRLTLQTPWEWADLPPELGELFFGYYDKSPWSADDRRMLMHHRRNGDPTVEIRVFDREHHTCKTIGRSGAWSFQQGAMAQWIMTDEQPHIIFNDVANDQLVSHIVTLEGKEATLIPVPIQAVHPDGGSALSLNYKRLLKLRREYGYTAAVTNFSADMPLDKDGIWHVDVRSNRVELIVTLAELMQSESRAGMNPSRTKVNHILFSPSGARCVFMHRWFNEGTKYSRLYTMESGSHQLKLVLESDLVSHYSWFDDERLIIYGSAPDRATGYFELNVTTGTHKLIGTGVLNRYGDGHPTVSPDRSWILTDAYPDAHFQQRLLLFNLEKEQLIEAGRFLHSPRYYNVTRCDLHPRWTRRGRLVSFDSVWSGTRQSYILDVSPLMQS